MRNKKGITIVELLVVLMVGAIMLLGINALSNIGTRSNRRILNEASIYNDIAYAFKLMQSRVHKSTIQNSATALITGSEKFDVYTHAGGRDLVYYPNRFDESINQVVFSVSDTDTLNFNHPVDNSVGNVAITLSGEKDGVPFDITTKIQSRRY